MANLGNGDFGDLEKNGNNEHFSHSRKREIQRLFFVFTKFPSNGDKETLEIEETEFQNSLKKICKEFQYSHEICPTTGKLHFQGQMMLTKKMRRSQIVKFKHLNMYLEPQRGSQSDQDRYITKCTDHHIKWSSSDENKTSEFVKYIETAPLQNVISMYDVLIDKLYYKDKDDNQYRKNWIENSMRDIAKPSGPIIIDGVEVAPYRPGLPPDVIDHHRSQLYRNFCKYHFEELEHKKYSQNMIEKFLM